MHKKDAQEVVRVTAASKVLDFSARFSKDEDLAARIEALEQMAGEDG
jgi:hypothetical protein